MSGDGAIPAAHIQDVDLSAADAECAVEIRRLGDLMERGEETPEQFARLIRLLDRVGQTRKAEYLLRRNYEVAAGGLELYRDLFGTEKPDEFIAAVEAFAKQFGVGLEFVESRDWLQGGYRIKSESTAADRLRILGGPCGVQFDYASPNAVRADVSSAETDEYVILRWARGVWEVGDPDDRGGES